MLVMVFARNHLRSSIGEVTTASVATGVLGVGGNKGAVAVEFSLHRRKVAVVCSHFAAHQVGAAVVGRARKGAHVTHHWPSKGTVAPTEQACTANTQKLVAPVAAPAGLTCSSKLVDTSLYVLMGGVLAQPCRVCLCLQGAVELRNANYATICRHLTFSRRAWYADDEAAAAPSLASATSAKAKAPPAGHLSSAAVYDDAAGEGRSPGPAMKAAHGRQA
jgi:hypothetical protein